MGANNTEHNEHVLWDEEDEYWAQLDGQQDALGSNADNVERCNTLSGRVHFYITRKYKGHEYVNTCP